MKTNPQSNDPQKGKQGKAFGKWAFYLAWLSFLATVGLAVFEAIKKHSPPERDEYL